MSHFIVLIKYTHTNVRIKSTLTHFGGSPWSILGGTLRYSAIWGRLLFSADETWLRGGHGQARVLRFLSWTFREEPRGPGADARPQAQQAQTPGDSAPRPQAQQAQTPWDSAPSEGPWGRRDAEKTGMPRGGAGRLAQPGRGVWVMF